MFVGRRIPLFLLIVVSGALIAAACGGDDGDGERSPAAGSVAQAGDAQGDVDLSAAETFLATQDVRPKNDLETRYFTDLQGAFDLFGSAAAGADQETREAGGARAALFQGLLNAGAGTAFVPVLERLRELEPPAGYEADHALLIGLYEELTGLDRAIAEAAVEGDFAAFVIANVRLGQAGNLVEPLLSSNTCNTLTRGNAATCAEREPIPGGAYGQAVHDALRPVVAATLAGTNVIFAGERDADADEGVPMPTGEEIGRIIAALVGEVMELRATALAVIETLEPPEELAGDHVFLLLWMEDTLAGERIVLAQAERGAITEPIQNGSVQAAALAGPGCRTLPDVSSEMAVIIGFSIDEEEFVEFCADVLGER